jgi:hypothetical protein
MSCLDNYEQKMLDAMNDISLFDTEFVRIVSFDKLENVSKRVDFLLHHPLYYECSFTLSSIGELSSFCIYNGETLVLGKSFDKKDCAYLIFSSLWENYKNHHNLRLRLLFPN